MARFDTQDGGLYADGVDNAVVQQVVPAPGLVKFSPAGRALGDARRPDAKRRAFQEYEQR